MIFNFANFGNILIFKWVQYQLVLFIQVLCIWYPSLAIKLYKSKQFNFNLKIHCWYRNYREILKIVLWESKAQNLLNLELLKRYNDSLVKSAKRITWTLVSTIQNRNWPSLYTEHILKFSHTQISYYNRSSLKVFDRFNNCTKISARYYETHRFWFSDSFLACSNASSSATLLFNSSSETRIQQKEVK